MNAKLRAATLATAVAVVAATGGAHVRGANAHAAKTTHVAHAAYVLQLHGRSLVPRGIDIEGIRRAGAGPRVHFLVQLRSLPTIPERRHLAALGLHLLGYVGGRTYDASFPRARLATLTRLHAVRAALPYRASDKVESSLKDGTTGRWARVGRTRVRLVVQIQPDVALSSTTAALAGAGGRGLEIERSIHAVAGTFPRFVAARLARIDGVLWVAAVEPKPSVTSVGAADAANVSQLRAAPYNLTGAGTTALVIDGGVAQAGHPDFGSRLTDETGVPTGLHATNVTGIIGGDGSNSAATVAGEATTIVPVPATPPANSAGWVAPGQLPQVGNQVIDVAAPLISQEKGTPPLVGGSSYSILQIGTGPTQEEVNTYYAELDHNVNSGRQGQLVWLTAPLQFNHAAGEPVTVINGDYAKQWEGVAPGATLHSYSFETRNTAGLKSLMDANTGAADVVNMSFARNYTDPNCNGRDAAYDDAAATYDTVVATDALTLVKAAGNEQQANKNGAIPCATVPSPPAAGWSQFYSIERDSTAKNPIIVGAINASVNTMTSFSSWGPTADGRVKPDIVAPGCSADTDAGIRAPGFADLPQYNGASYDQPDGYLTSAPQAEFQNTYVQMCGTSQATPVVSGAVALLTQAWKDDPNGDGIGPNPATAKAILVQTADRPGVANAPADGSTWTWPNFTEGWGILNTKAAIDLVRANSTDDLVHEDSVSPGAAGSPEATQKYVFHSDGVNDVTVTLAWTDPAGSPLAAGKELVNDLNLTVTGPPPANKVWHPWTLPAGTAPTCTPPGAGQPCTSSTNQSVRAVDNLNNVELVWAPKQAGDWTVTVDGSGITNAKAQDYTVILPHESDPISVENSTRMEGDSGTKDMIFDVTLEHPLDADQHIDYATQGGSASPGTDFQQVSGTLTIPKGQTDGEIHVPIIGNVDDQPDRTFTLVLSNPQPDEPIQPSTVTGTIIDDDGTRNFTVIGRTGQSYQTNDPQYAAGTLTGVEPYLAINDKGDVVFAGDASSGGQGLFSGNGQADPVNFNPKFTGGPRRFENVSLANDGLAVANDIFPGAPATWYIRQWHSDGTWNILENSNDTGEADVSAIYSRKNDNLAFTAVPDQGGAYVGTGDGAQIGTDLVAPNPINDNDGDIVFRSPYRDANNVYDVSKSPIVFYGPGGSGPQTIACNSGCTNDGYVNLGWKPGLSDTGGLVVFYGDYEGNAQGVQRGPGMFISVPDPDTGARTVTRIASLGDSAITKFEDQQRIGVNATQDSQHAVTVVFVADSPAGKGIYTVRVSFPPLGPPKAESPTLVARVGDTVDGIGPIGDLSLPNRPINNKNGGDIVFWASGQGSPAPTAAVAIYQPVTPILFVPGVAGSVLVDKTTGDNIWVHFPLLGNDEKLGKALSLRPTDRLNYDIRPTGLVMRAPDMPGGQIIYQNFINSLTAAGYVNYDVGQDGQNVDKCDESQRPQKPTLFTFPYDWRLSNAQNAVRLKGYMDCIQKFYPGTKVNIVSHSMGGLLTRRTIISQPGFADEINAWIALMPPFLGAPKLIYVLRSGDFIRGGPWGAIAVASGPGVKYAMPTLTGPLQLMPSRAYYRVATATGDLLPYGELNRDLNGNGNKYDVYSSFDTMASILDRFTPGFQPAEVADAFHSQQQDDFSQDNYTYNFYEIWGKQADKNTVGQVLESTKELCEGQVAPPDQSSYPEYFCSTDSPMVLAFTTGDGTVPSISAARTDTMQEPAPFNKQILEMDETGGGPDSVSHNGILNNPDLQTQVLKWLADEGGLTPPQQQNAPMMRAAPAGVSHTVRLKAATRTAADVTTSVRSIAVYGATATTADASGASLPVTFDANGQPVTPELPNTDLYYLSDTDRLFRSRSTAALTTTFTKGSTPVEVDETSEDATGKLLTVTKFANIQVPAGTPVELSTPASGTPQLLADENGDGTYETSITPTANVSGTAALDTTPPTITGSTTRAAGATSVSLSAADDSSGVASIYYSLDNATYRRYTGPFTVDPSVTTVYALADDKAGNRGNAVVTVGEAAVLSPTALDISVTTDENTQATFGVSAFSSSGRPLTYAWTDPSHGSVTASNGKLVYTPQHDFYGTDSFTYTADDGFLKSAPATVTITVNHVNQPPEGSIGGPATISEGAAASAYTANLSDPDGDPFTVSWQASGGTFTSSGSTATLSADDGPASIVLTITATDSNGATATIKKTITVTNTPPKVTAPATLSAFWGLPLAFSGSATDSSAADRAAGLTPSWLFGDGSTPVAAFSASHTYTAAGSFTAKLSATDKDGGVGTAATAVTVRARTATLAYTGPATATYGYAVPTATLADTVDPASAQLASHSIAFVFGSAAYSAATGATGVATAVPAAPIALGTYNVVTRFAGDTRYAAATAPTKTVSIVGSIGTVTGTSLVSADNGARASFTVSSTTGTSFSGNLSYTAGATSLTATSLAPLGIAADGTSAWFSGVATTGQKLVVYVEDHGASGDLFKIWINGALATPSGRLTGGDVAIRKT
ncbi:MAG TPA: S8 family serine peptidase [Gaiellaceae bacterium]